MRDRLKTAPLNREHVAIGFRAIWQMKLKYCLGATCFSKKQHDKLQARYLPGPQRSCPKWVSTAPWQPQFSAG
jgi:hypothetical protein